MVGDRHFGQSYDDKHHHHYKPESHVRVADNGKIMHTDRSLFRGAECREDYLSGGVAHVAQQLGKYNE